MRVGHPCSELHGSTSPALGSPPPPMSCTSVGVFTSPVPAHAAIMQQTQSTQAARVARLRTGRRGPAAPLFDPGLTGKWTGSVQSLSVAFYTVTRHIAYLIVTPRTAKTDDVLHSYRYLHTLHMLGTLICNWPYYHTDTCNAEQ